MRHCIVWDPVVTSFLVQLKKETSIKQEENRIHEKSQQFYQIWNMNYVIFHINTQGKPKLFNIYLCINIIFISLFNINKKYYKSNIMNCRVYWRKKAFPRTMFFGHPIRYIGNSRIPNIFTEHPIIAFRRNRNLQDILGKEIIFNNNISYVKILIKMVIRSPATPN